MSNCKNKQKPRKTEEQYRAQLTAENVPVEVQNDLCTLFYHMTSKERIAYFKKHPILTHA